MDNNNQQLKTAIVCLAADENLYIRDWVAWHTTIGFSKIFVIDNSPADRGDYPEQVLGDYVELGRVQVIHMRKTCAWNPLGFQQSVYTLMYQALRNTFDWIFFIDCDEFVMFSNESGFKSINDYLASDICKDAQQIRMNWMCFGDNGQLHYMKKPVWERFKSPMKDITKPDWWGKVPVNMTLKTAVNCNKADVADFVSSHSPHYPLTNEGENAVVISPSGHRRPHDKAVHSIDYKTMFLGHFRTLSTEEFLYKRIAKYGPSDATGARYTKDRYMKVYCVENEMTPEKKKLWDDFMEKYEREHPGAFAEEEGVANPFQTPRAYRDEVITRVVNAINGDAVWSWSEEDEEKFRNE